MKSILSSSLHSLLFLLISIPAANAAGSLLRVTCSGDDVGAEISINGKYKGECPLDIQIPEGSYKLRLEKHDATYDHLFEQNIRIGDGVVKKVEAVLSKRLNASGQRLEDEAVQQLGVAMLVGSEWSVVSNADQVYTGKLNVYEKLGTNAFKGVVDISYGSASSQSRVRQDASITVEGNSVTILCSNPVMITGRNGSYGADKFYLKIVNPKFLKGGNYDANLSNTTFTRD